MMMRGTQNNFAPGGSAPSQDTVITTRMDSTHLSEEVTALREGLNARTNALLDDFDCMRFLRARQMNVPKAIVMAAEWGTWATEVLPGSRTGRTPLNILDDIEDPDEEYYTQYCPHCLEGEDKEGRPIFWEKTGEGSHHFGELKKHLSHDAMIARHVRLQQLIGCRLRHNSERHGRRLEKMVVVNDFKDISMYPDLDSVKFAIGVLKCDQNFFPERLQTVFAINCPWYMTALYALISPFMDEVTKGKIRIVGYDFIDALLEEIDEDQIPEDFGGSLKARWAWPFGEDSGCSPAQIEQYRYKGAAPTDEDGEFSHVGDAHDVIDDISP